MIKLEELQQEIANSGMTQFQKGEVNNLLPNFGQRVLEFVFKESQKLRFELIGDALTDVLKIMLFAQNNLLKGNSFETIEILTQAAFNNRWENGLYILPWALDIKDVIKAKKDMQSPELLGALFGFELDMLEYLPKEEVVELFGSQLLFAISNSDLLMELKNYAYKKRLVDDSVFLQSILRTIQNNEEYIGNDNIIIDGKLAQPTIKNWLNDFLFLIRKVDGGINTFEEVKYSKISKNFLALAEQEKTGLLKIFKLYAWLSNPVVTETEIENFVNEKVKRQNDNASLVSEKYALPFEAFSDTNKAEAPVMFSPKNQPLLRPVVEIQPAVMQAKSEPLPLRPVNIQDILKKKEAEFQPGIMFGGGDGGRSFIPNPSSLTQKPVNNPSASKQEDINKKLEELKKKTETKVN